MNNLIFNPGRDRVKPKHVARLFEPLPTGFEIDGKNPDMYRHCDLRVGNPDGDSDWQERDIANATEAHSKLGTFAERNRKEKKECKVSSLESVKQSTDSQSASDLSSRQETKKFTRDMPVKSPSSQPEFRIGDLVECLPDHEWTKDSFELMLAQVGAISRIAHYVTRLYLPCVGLAPLMFLWPVRALRHAETEPRKEDGWKKECDYFWSRDKYEVFRSDLGYWWGYFKDGTVFGASKTGGFHHDSSKSDDFNSWLELKRAIEEKK